GLGVTLTSRATSRSPSWLAREVPGIEAEGKSRMPAEVSLKPNSAAEHSMPSDITPATCSAAIRWPAGSTDPTTADQQPPCAGMDGDLGNSPHDNALERGTPLLHLFHFQPCHGEPVSHCLRCHLNGHKLSQPLKTHPHDLPS